MKALFRTSILFLYFLFFSLSLLALLPTPSFAVTYDCGINVYTTSNCGGNCTSSKPTCVKQGTTAYYKCCLACSSKYNTLESECISCLRRRWYSYYCNGTKYTKSESNDSSCQSSSACKTTTTKATTSPECSPIGYPDSTNGWAACKRVCLGTGYSCTKDSRTNGLVACCKTKSGGGGGGGGGTTPTTPSIIKGCMACHPTLNRVMDHWWEQNTTSCHNDLDPYVKTNQYYVEGSKSQVTGDTNCEKTSDETTVLSLIVGLDGIGATGDNQNPEDTNCSNARNPEECGSNQDPNRKERSIQIKLFKTTGEFAYAFPGKINYQAGDTNNGKYTGLATYNKSDFVTGSYIVKIIISGYLDRDILTPQTVTAAKTNTLPAVRMVTGNINNDGDELDIRDYNILMSCSVFSPDNNGACNENSSYKTLADLEDNGEIDFFDYNLFLRDMSVPQEYYAFPSPTPEIVKGCMKCNEEKNRVMDHWWEQGTTACHNDLDPYFTVNSYYVDGSRSQVAGVAECEQATTTVTPTPSETTISTPIIKGCMKCNVEKNRVMDHWWEQGTTACHNDLDPYFTTNPYLVPDSESQTFGNTECEIITTVSTSSATPEITIPRI